MRENIDTYKTLVRKPESKGPFVTETEHDNGSKGNKLDVNWIHPNLETVQYQAFVHETINYCVP